MFTFLVQFSYDRFGRQKEAVYPDGRRIALEFQYGGVRSVGSLAASGGGTYASLWRHGDYHADGSLATYLQGNGIAFHRRIDGAERTLQICYDTFPTNPPSLALCAQTTELWDSGAFQYDFAGDIVSIGTDNFFYDRLSRLKEATVNRHPHDTFANGPQPAGSVTLDYAYDGFGNITDRRLTAMTNYTVGTNPLELFGGRNYTPGVAPVTDNQIHEAGFLYDANGNLISDGVKDFVYDELNQQIEVREVTTSCAAAGDGAGSFESSANAGEEAIPHGTLCYGRGTLVEKNGYDGGGMRVVRETYDPVTSFPKRTTYARLGGSVVKEYAQEFRTITSPAPELSHEKAYIYGPLGLLATEELCTFNCKSDESAGINVTRYYEYDHLGTVRAITKADGTLESSFDYEPFGLELKGTTASWTTDTSSNTHRFTGHERDEEAGEDYMKARMYVLSTARFPQIDPKFGGAGDPQNWNPYIYVLNSPVGASDPTGTLPIPYGDKFAGREMTATLGPGEGASGFMVSGSVGSLSADTVSHLLSIGFTMTQIQSYVYNGVNATTTIVGQSVGGAAPAPAPVLRVQFSMPIVDTMYFNPVRPSGKQHISKSGLNFLRSCESLRLNIYDDGAGNPTIGWGHLLTDAEIKNGVFLNGITREQADSIFAKDVAEIGERAVRSALLTTLSQSQYDALVSLGYNIGPRGLKESPVTRAIMNGSVSSLNVHQLFLNHNRSGGSVMQGLIRRRDNEANMYEMKYYERYPNSCYAN